MSTQNQQNVTLFETQCDGDAPPHVTIRPGGSLESYNGAQRANERTNINNISNDFNNINNISQQHTGEQIPQPTGDGGMFPQAPSCQPARGQHCTGEQIPQPIGGMFPQPHFDQRARGQHYFEEQIPQPTGGMFPQPPFDQQIPQPYSQVHLNQGANMGEWSTKESIPRPMNPPPSGFIDGQQYQDYGIAHASGSMGGVDWNHVAWPAPSIDKDNIQQSLDDFERFCQLASVPFAHRQRLLLTELKRCSGDAFLEFLRSQNTSYESLKTFLRTRFDNTASIHKLKINPTWLTKDAFSQFSSMCNIVATTSHEEIVKFLVLKTSPKPIQDALEGVTNLPYNMFYRRYKAELKTFNSTTSRPGPKRSSFVGNPQPTNGGRHESRSSFENHPQSFTSPRQQRNNTRAPFPNNTRPSFPNNTRPPFPNNTRPPFQGGADMSRKNNTGHQDLCEYHVEFGHLARNCGRPDCKMRSLVDQAIRDHREGMDLPSGSKNGMGRSY